MTWHGRFDECRVCVWFKTSRPSARCLKCSVGEFFEEKVNDGELDQETLMDIYRGMNDED